MFFFFHFLERYPLSPRSSHLNYQDLNSEFDSEENPNSLPLATGLTLVAIQIEFDDTSVAKIVNILFQLFPSRMLLEC